MVRRPKTPSHRRTACKPRRRISRDRSAGNPIDGPSGWRARAKWAPLGAGAGVRRAFGTRGRARECGVRRWCRSLSATRRHFPDIPAFEKALRRARRGTTEKILKIKAQKNVLCDVRRSEGGDGAALDESVNGVVCGYQVQNSGENPPLQSFQIRLRGFEQPDSTGPLLQNPVMIMLQLRV